MIRKLTFSVSCDPRSLVSCAVFGPLRCRDLRLIEELGKFRAVM